MKFEITLSRKRPKADAIKVDHTNALVPPPTAALLMEMAMGIHLSVAGAAALHMNEEFMDWDTLPSNVKDYWMQGARCAYAVIAIHGGGTVKELNA